MVKQASFMFKVKSVIDEHVTVCNRQPMPPTPWLSLPPFHQRGGTSGQGALPCLLNEIENVCKVR